MGKKAAGFITLHRQIMDWEWYRHPHTAFLFIHLLLSANFTDGLFKGRVIKRGQLATSVTKLSTDTGLSIQTIKTALAHLQLTGEITNDANRQYRVITVVKYDDYQKVTDKSTNDQPTINQRPNRQLTNDLTGNQPQYNNNNNINNENKETNKQNTYAVDQDDSFDVFWNAYPKKVDKQTAMKAWKKINPDGVLLGQIMLGVQKWKESEQWRKEDGQYIPYPSTWLNKRRWEEAPKAHTEIASLKRTIPAPVTVQAQNYEQRDYADVQAEFERKQAERIMARLRAEGRTDR